MYVHKRRQSIKYLLTRLHGGRVGGVGGDLDGLGEEGRMGEREGSEKGWWRQRCKNSEGK